MYTNISNNRNTCIIWFLLTVFHVSDEIVIYYICVLDVCDEFLIQFILKY